MNDRFIAIDPLIANKNIVNDPSQTIHHDDPLQTIHREEIIANNPSRPIHHKRVIVNDSLQKIHHDRSFNQVRVIANDCFLVTYDQVSSRTIVL